MSSISYITAACKIIEGTVYKNGIALFQDNDVSLNDFLPLVYRHLNLKYPKFYKMDNMSKAGFIAAEILLQDNFRAENYEAESIGLILSNANSSLDADIKYFTTTSEISSPALFVYTLPNIVIGEICIRHHFKGESTFFIADRFDADFIHGYVNNLLNNDTLQVCICGWIEVLSEQYHVALILVEKRKPEAENPALSSEIFTVENLRKHIH